MTPIEKTLRKLNKLRKNMIDTIIEYISWHFNLNKFNARDNYVSLPEDVVIAIRKEPAIEEAMIDLLAKDRLTFVLVGNNGAYIRTHLIACRHEGKIYSLAREIGIETLNKKFNSVLKPFALKLKGADLDKVKLAEERFGIVNIHDEFRRNHYNLHKTSTGEYIVSKFGIEVSECL